MPDKRDKLHELLDEFLNVLGFKTETETDETETEETETEETETDETETEEAPPIKGKKGKPQPEPDESEEPEDKEEEAAETERVFPSLSEIDELPLSDLEELAACFGKDLSKKLRQKSEITQKNVLKYLCAVAEGEEKHGVEEKYTSFALKILGLKSKQLAAFLDKCREKVSAGGEEPGKDGGDGEEGGDEEPELNPSPALKQLVEETQRWLRDGKNKVFITAARKVHDGLPDDVGEAIHDYWEEVDGEEVGKLSEKVQQDLLCHLDGLFCDDDGEIVGDLKTEYVHQGETWKGGKPVAKSVRRAKRTGKTGKKRT